MKKLAFGLAVLALGACAKDIPQNPPPSVVVAEFDPAQNPPVVPSPNDLAFNPATGKLQVPAGTSAADAELAAYLNTLNGFPADTTATANFTGKLDPASVTADSVKVFELTVGAPQGEDPEPSVTLTPVPDATVGYTDVAGSGPTGGQIAISPPAAGWTPGHSYVVAIVGYGKGVSGAKGEQVVGSPAWALLRSTVPLATCDSSGNCRANTGIIPSSATDPAAKIADQGQSAGQLEQIRLNKYDPDLKALQTQFGVDRNTVALLWSFNIADNIVTPTFSLSPDKCAVKIPLPNDIAIDPTTGLVAAPANCEGQTPSEQEFTADYLNHLDGFPTAAEASETFVGGQVDGGAFTVDSKHVVFADLTELAALQSDGGFDADAGVFPGAPDAARVHFDGTTKMLSIDPPAGGWQKGHQYAVALLNGITGTNGEALVASDVFALVRSSSPLVDCDVSDPATDLSTCHTTITLAPLTDAQAVQLEQIRLGLAPAFDALGLDRTDVAVLWTFKIFDNPELQFNPSPVDTVLPFPFNGRTLPVSGFETALALFLPGDGGAPGHVNLPVTPGDPNAALYAGLDTLDGFSTTAPILTSFGSTFPRDLTGDAGIDPATVTEGTDDGGFGSLGLVNLAGTEAPKFNSCVNCDKASRLLDAGADEPEHLAIVPKIPLLEKTDYAAYATIDLKDTEGVGIAPSSVFALIRMKHPVVDPADPACAAHGGICIPALAQAVAAGQLSITEIQLVEVIRQRFSDLFDALDADGLPRGQLALAWDFHTQSTWSTLVGLHAAPALLAQAGFPIAGGEVYDATTSYTAQMQSANLPSSDVGKVMTASYLTPLLLVQNDGTYGPFNADVIAGNTPPTPQKVPLVIFEPDTTAHPAPPSGYPVVIFGHGITQWRNDASKLANAFNALGYAVVSFDEPFHGDRSFCIGAGQAIAGALGVATALPDAKACMGPSGILGQDVTCDDTPGSETYGRCIGTTRTTACVDAPGLPADVFCQQQNMGNCASDGFCEGGTPLALPAGTKPLVSGWNFIDLPSVPTQFFFPTRDHFRQDVVDLGQLELVLAQPASLGTSLNAQLVAAGASPLDGSSVNYVGQSLGGILGTLYTSSSVAQFSALNLPVVQGAVLNVPGGDLPLIILTSPNLGILRNPLIAGLSAAGATPGSPTFDLIFNFAQWVLDPADPVNSANHLNDQTSTTGPTSPEARHVLVQYIDQDQTVPNPATNALIASANRDAAAPQVSTHEYTPTEAEWPVDSTISGRHGFLLEGYRFQADGGGTEAAITAAAQAEAAAFVADGGTP